MFFVFIFEHYLSTHILFHFYFHCFTHTLAQQLTCTHAPCFFFALRHAMVQLNRWNNLVFTVTVSQHSKREYDRNYCTSSQEAPGSRPKFPAKKQDGQKANGKAVKARRICRMQKDR
jgi:hypothetical protein